MDKADLGSKDYAQELRINIARARTAEGYSQDGVAADACLSSFTYWKLERGELTPSSSPSPRRWTSN